MKKNIALTDKKYFSNGQNVALWRCKLCYVTRKQNESKNDILLTKHNFIRCIAYLFSFFNEIACYGMLLIANFATVFTWGRRCSRFSFRFR